MADPYNFSSIFATLNEAKLRKEQGLDEDNEDEDEEDKESDYDIDEEYIGEPIRVGKRYCLICAEKGILKKGGYGLKGGIPNYCKPHTSPNMVNLVDPKCQHPDGCNTRAAYNYLGQTEQKYCGKHKIKGMANVTIKPCGFEGCIIKPICGLPGTTTALYCDKHKLPGMKNIITKKCIYEGGCDTTPVFGMPGSKKVLYCDAHKLPGMKNLRNKSCIYTGCDTLPTYNYKGIKPPIYCVLHKLDGMEPNGKTCKFPGGCSTRPNYNFPGLKPEYCRKHISEGMEDVAHRKCKVCRKQATFNYIGIKMGIYCTKHKLEGMEDITKTKCTNCESHVRYGFPAAARTHCAKHKLVGMTRYPNQKCLHVATECKELALYGFGIPLHCELHKLENEVNHVEKNCSKCGLLMILNNLGLCQYCGDFTHKYVRLAKQTAVKEFFDANEIKYDSYDKALDRECGLERPDFVFNRGSFSIIVEIDENQHGSYPEACECQRMVNIHQSFGGLKVIFIRYNPDKYKGDQLTDHQKKQYLLSWIDWITANPPTFHLSFIKLFFDGFTGSEVKPIEIPTI